MESGPIALVSTHRSGAVNCASPVLLEPSAVPGPPPSSPDRAPGQARTAHRARAVPSGSSRSGAPMRVGRPEYIGLGGLINQERMEADLTHLWEYSPPRAWAGEEEVVRAEVRLGFRLPESSGSGCPSPIAPSYWRPVAGPTSVTTQKTACRQSPCPARMATGHHAATTGNRKAAPWEGITS